MDKIEKIELKDRILDLAKEKLAKVGYKNVRTDDLAHDLGISKRTLYEHFSSKEKLILQLLNNTLDEFHQNMSSIAGRMIDGEKESFFTEFGLLWETVAVHTSFFTLELYEDIKKHLPEFYALCKNFDHERFSKFQKVFLVGVKHGFYKSEINEQLFFHIIYNSLNTIIQPNVLSNLSLSVEEVITQIHKVVFTGAMTESAQKEFNHIFNKKKSIYN